MDFFNSLYQAEKANQITQDLQGRTFGITFAVVADVADPLALGRIKVMLPSKGAKTLTDWLVRLTPTKLISVPLVDIGDTVAVSFVNGDPKNGCYLGVINNLPQPPANDIKTTVSVNGETYSLQTDKDFTIVVGESAVTITKDDISLATGSSSLKLTTDGTLEITGVSSVTINNKKVMVVGGKDDDGDTMIQSGQ